MLSPVASAQKTTKTAADEKKTDMTPKHQGDKKVGEPKAISDGNLETEGFSAGDKKFQDKATMGHEEKFDAKTVSISDVSGGEKSLMGKDESLPTNKPEVPAGGGQMGQETWEGGNVETKGTVIAKDHSQNRKTEVSPAVREARLKAASAYLADSLRHGEITEAEYSQQLDEMAGMSVPAILDLAKKARIQRARINAVAEKNAAAEAQSQTKVAGLGTAVVINSSSNEKSLAERIQEQFTLHKKFKDVEER
jgi:hypothetical protein